MKAQPRKRDWHGRLAKEDYEPKKRCTVTIAPELVAAIVEYQKTYGFDSFSSALANLVQKGLESEGLSVEYDSHNVSTDISAPVNARSNDSSAVVLGNANTTTISKKSRSQRGHLPRERE